MNVQVGRKSTKTEALTQIDSAEGRASAIIHRRLRGISVFCGDYFTKR